MKLFGTDGVRGKAGAFLDAITALKLAQAAGIYFRKHSKNHFQRLRRSYPIFENIQKQKESY